MKVGVFAVNGSTDANIPVTIEDFNCIGEQIAFGAKTVEGVTLNKSALILEQGDNEVLVATVLPENAVDKTVTWSSDNDSIATVDQFGNVVAVGEGTAVITVTTTNGGYTASCVVTVTGRSSSSASVTRYDVTVEETSNGTVKVSNSRPSAGLTVTVTLTPDEGYKADGVTVTDAKGNAVAVTDKGDSKYTFRMPRSNVTVKASFTKDDTPVETGLPFTDVKSGDWFYEAVKYVYDNKLMDGTSSTTFAPLMTTNRAMIVTILWRLEGQPETDATLSFTDVESGVWYTDAVNWAASKGIVKGYSDTVFAPNDTVTREQLATILYRYAETKGYDVTAEGNLSTFADGTNTSSWAAEAMEWAVGSGLLSGKDGGKLDPTGTATRAEIATILMRFAENEK